jgi:hypothetical protein
MERSRSAVMREHACTYLLTSLVAFAITVILTRTFLQLTGFPQIGNSVLHIAHALWGGLLLFLAVLLPLAFANRWALQASAILSGLGIGLFIDEVGKFITQTNDYFFPPALSLIYGFFLLCLFLYFLFRRMQKDTPRGALYRALEGFQEFVDGGLDVGEAENLEALLTTASMSEREEVASLAAVLREFLQDEKGHLTETEYSVGKRMSSQIDSLGRRIGRRTHRIIISGILMFWLVLVVGFIAILVSAGPELDEQVLQWRGVLAVIQLTVGVLMLVAFASWIRQNEERGIRVGTLGFLVSLVALQLSYFYLSQFSAITATLIQVVFLIILQSYRRWYI